MAAKNAMEQLWGTTPKATRWLYEAMIKPIITYGAIIWAHKIPLNYKPLVRIQRLALLCLGHFPKRIPTAGLEVATHYLPLQLEAQNHAEKTALRIRGRNRRTWDGIGHGQHRGHLCFYNSDLPTSDLSLIHI